MRPRPTPEPEAQMRITDWLRDHPRRQYHDAANYIDSLERERDELAESILNLSHPNCQMLLRERDEAREQRAKAVEKYQASIKEMHEVGMQRDRLAEALQNLCDRFLGNKSSRDITDQIVEAGKALAALNQQEP